MEFYVVDPKELDYQQWIERVRGFCEAYGKPFTEEEGGLYFLGDDIASPWHEHSVKFTIEGDEGGIIEVRDEDRAFYVFTDDLRHLDQSELRQSLGFQSSPPGAVYGFRAANTKGCRFHLGPVGQAGFLVRDEEADYPPQLSLKDVWTLFFGTIRHLQSNLSKIQDLRGRRAERVSFDFEVDVTFSHPASLDALSELLAEEEGYERHKATLRANFRDRDHAFVHKFVAELPEDEEDIEEAFFRAVWRGTLEGKEYEIVFCGVERRALRPFVQMPLHRTSKALMDALRADLKGHRIDRQEYQQLLG